MLAELRRGPVRGDVDITHPDEDRQLPHHPSRRVGHLRDPPCAPMLRVVHERVVVAIDRFHRRHAGRRERVEEVGGRPLPHRPLDRRGLLGRRTVELDVEDLGQPVNRIVRGGDEAEPPVTCRVQALERPGAVLHDVEPAGAHRGAVGHPHDVGEVRHRRVQLRVLDHLADARAPPLDQGHEHADGSEQTVPRILVADRRHGLVELTGHLVRDADVAREHRGEALAESVRAGRPPAGCVEVDDPRVDGPHRVVVEAEALGRARPQVVVDDVGPPEEGLDRGAELGVLGVGGEAALARLRGEERVVHPSQLIAGRRLELDDIRPVVREEPGRVRPGVVGPEV